MTEYQKTEKTDYQHQLNQIDHALNDVFHKKKELDTAETELKHQKQQIQQSMDKYNIMHSAEYTACSSLKDFQKITTDEFVQFSIGLNATANVYSPEYTRLITTNLQIILDIKNIYPMWKFIRVETVSTYRTFHLQRRFYFEDDHGFLFSIVS